MIPNLVTVIILLTHKTACLVIIISSSVTDLDGLGSCQQGGQLLSDCQRLERAATHTDSSPEVDAGESIQSQFLQ